jgi:hypothetical protein
LPDDGRHEHAVHGTPSVQALRAARPTFDVRRNGDLDARQTVEHRAGIDVDSVGADEGEVLVARGDVLNVAEAGVL